MGDPLGVRPELVEPLSLKPWGTCNVPLMLCDARLLITRLDDTCALCDASVNQSLTKSSDQSLAPTPHPRRVHVRVLSNCDSLFITVIADFTSVFAIRLDNTLALHRVLLGKNQTEFN